MKPAFALDFRNDSVSLLHRAAGGWQMLGSVALDTPDLPDALNYLRSTALGLSPKGLTTKLILPNDQILYTSVTVADPTPAKRQDQISKALEGRTPYDVADLAFDILGDGPQVIVAVIAKETLAEAEAFAVEHRFNPVSFVAVPEREDIVGEAWFGMTAGAEAFIGAGKKVERDSTATMILARARPAETAPPAAPQSAAAAPAPAASQQSVPETAEPALKADPVAKPHAEPAPVLPPVQPQLDLPAPVITIAVAALPLEPARPAPVSTDAASDRELAARLGETLAKPIEQPPQTADPKAASEFDSDEAPMALDVVPEDGLDDEPQGADVIRKAIAGKSARVTEPTIEDPKPADPPLAGLAGFNSRRVDSNATTGSAPLVGAAPPLRAGTRSVPKATPTPPSKAAAIAKRGAGALATAASATAKAAKRHKADLPAAAADAAATLSAAPASGRSLPKGPGGFALRKPVRARPRYLGLILTVVLLFLLAMVAAWSSYSLGAWNKAPSAPEAAQTAAAPLPEAGQSDLTQTADQGALADPSVPDVVDEMAADLQDPEAIADGQAAVAPDLAAQGPANAPTVAQTAPAAAALNGTQDEIYLASMDAPPSAPDPLSLPLPEPRGDTLPVASAAAPPFGTVYQFAENGTIRATPEGVITPDGVLLRQGKPPRVPAARPAAVAATAAATQSPAAPSAAAALAAASLAANAPAQVFADPALAEKSPKPRPANLQPATVPADQGSLAPAAGSRIASLRPQPRPQTRLAAGESARIASAAAGLTGAASLLTDASSNSPQAIAISRKPVARPKDMSRAVEAAIASALQEPAPALASSTAGIALQPAAPEADGEPDVVASNQQTPLRTTVAKQATYKNVINLSQLNLIGVYGTQSSRYALVRQANGRYKKVRVGDNIDGGRVAAITATEVRYQKGNRLIALAMPKD